MAKKVEYANSLPAPVAQNAKQLGKYIRLARKRRDMTQGDLAERMFVGIGTVVRLERGEPSIGLGIVLTALFCLQLSFDIAALAAPDTDAIGNSLDQRRHNTRKAVRKKTMPSMDF